ncbi:hypothetical protein B0H13DRAFT_2378519 [Mycena leptocephala]|nr:hypothetical protein B0H13DRAFT_2378519 [Mycena leptocephala]
MLRGATTYPIPAPASLITTSSTSSLNSPPAAPSCPGVSNFQITRHIHSVASADHYCARLTEALLNLPHVSLSLHRPSHRPIDTSTSTRSSSLRADKSPRSFRARTDTRRTESELLASSSRTFPGGRMSPRAPSSFPVSCAEPCTRVPPGPPAIPISLRTPPLTASVADSRSASLTSLANYDGGDTRRRSRLRQRAHSQIATELELGIEVENEVEMEMYTAFRGRWRWRWRSHRCSPIRLSMSLLYAPWRWAWMYVLPIALVLALGPILAVVERGSSWLHLQGTALRARNERRGGTCTRARNAGSLSRRLRARLPRGVRLTDAAWLTDAHRDLKRTWCGRVCSRVGGGGNGECGSGSGCAYFLPSGVRGLRRRIRTPIRGTTKWACGCTLFHARHAHSVSLF